MRTVTLPTNYAETGPAVQFALRVMRPLIRVFLRFGVTCDALTAIIRWLYVEVSSENREFHLKTKVSKSRVACITGLSRRAVDEILQSGSPEAMIGQKKGNRAARVLNGWLNDQRFLDGRGKPRTIPLRSVQGISFFQLSKEYSDDVPMRTILDELVAAGSIMVENGEVQVTSKAYIPSKHNPSELLDVIGISIQDMVSNAEYNLRPDAEDRLLQREALEANIPAEKYSELRKTLTDEGVRFVEHCFKIIAKAADSKAHPRKKYHRVGMGVYYFDDTING